MASGDGFGWFRSTAYEIPTANAAIPGSRNGHPILVFPSGLLRVANWTSWLPGNYSNGGLTLIVAYMCNSITGNVIWNAAIERIQSGTGDLDSDSFASAQAVTDTVPGTSGIAKYATITFTNGGQMDSLVANEAYRLQISRPSSGGTAVTDAQLLLAALRET